MGGRQWGSKQPLPKKAGWPASAAVQFFLFMACCKLQSVSNGDAMIHMLCVQGQWRWPGIPSGAQHPAHQCCRHRGPVLRRLPACRPPPPPSCHPRTSANELQKVVGLRPGIKVNPRATHILSPPNLLVQLGIELAPAPARAAQRGAQQPSIPLRAVLQWQEHLQHAAKQRALESALAHGCAGKSSLALRQLAARKVQATCSPQQGRR